MYYSFVLVHEKTGLNFADEGPAAASEMVRNWILCKQGHYPSPPACRQTDPAACRDVDLQHWERAEKVSAVNKSDGPSLDLTASLFALPWQTTYAVCS